MLPESRTSDAVSLRPVEEGDLPFLFELQRDAVAARLAAFTPRARELFDAHWQRLLGDSSVLARAIELDGCLVGHIGSFPRGGVREVGYWVARNFWGRGVTTTALEAFLALDPVRPMHARVAAHNLGSLRVLAKCGFVELRREAGAPGTDGEAVTDVVLVREQE
jgi:RimJ/RimL family protein N-acetyltransferase